MPAKPFIQPLAAVLLAALAASPVFAADHKQPIKMEPDPGTGGGSTAPGIPEPDDDLGCQVMLCLASPNSPTEFAECVDPIEKLHDRLRKGRSFPKCDMGGGESGNYAEQRGDYIDVFIDGKLFTTVQWRNGGGGGTGPGGGGRDDGHDQTQEK